MISKTVAVFRQLLVMSTTLLTIGITATASFAQVNKVYSPLPLPSTYEVTDSLTDKDIPTGQGGFARDYTVKLNKGENLAVDLASDSFDSIITLLSPNGSTIAENDDGPDGSSNSLLFTRISETGSYIVRVRSFGETGVGAFKLKVTRLQPVK
ncbi:MAG: PPC domain-containing protein [Calothrix sp. FI2-JRJ7]|nr:PPC domain-containing protein [Calothrix sp. FI2-JRJ7]